MAEGAKEVVGGGGGAGDEGFSFVDKVRLMMYGEQEKEAFLIEKKEKEEKKKAKRLAAEAAGEDPKPKKQGIFGQVKSFFTSETPKDKTPSPGDPKAPPTEDQKAPLAETATEATESQDATG